jgi:hypothetical protein
VKHRVRITKGRVNPRLAEVERALYTYRSLALSDGGELPTSEELAAQISDAQQSWYTSPTKYSDALRVLPKLIVNSEQAVHESGRSREACRQASEVYQLARRVLKYLGRVDLGGMVSDRAMRYAEETEDPVLIAAATYSLGHSMQSDDMPGAALDLAMKSSEALEPLLPDGTPEIFSLYGGMQLLATLAALDIDDPWRARELLRGPATQAAKRVGDGHNYHNTVFGPTNVGIHAVKVEYESGEIVEAPQGNPRHLRSAPGSTRLRQPGGRTQTQRRHRARPARHRPMRHRPRRTWCQGAVRPSRKMAGMSERPGSVPWLVLPHRWSDVQGTRAQLRQLAEAEMSSAMTVAWSELRNAALSARHPRPMISGRWWGRHA